MKRHIKILKDLCCNSRRNNPPEDGKINIMDLKVQKMMPLDATEFEDYVKLGIDPYYVQLVEGSLGRRLNGIMVHLDNRNSTNGYEVITNIYAFCDKSDVYEMLVEINYARYVIIAGYEIENVELDELLAKLRNLEYYFDTYMNKFFKDNKINNTITDAIFIAMKIDFIFHVLPSANKRIDYIPDYYHDMDWWYDLDMVCELLDDFTDYNFKLPIYSEHISKGFLFTKDSIKFIGAMAEIPISLTTKSARSGKLFAK